MIICSGNGLASHYCQYYYLCDIWFDVHIGTCVVVWCHLYDRYVLPRCTRSDKMWVTEVGHVGTGYKCSCSQPANAGRCESHCRVGMRPGAALVSHNASRIRFILAVFCVW